MKAIKLLGTRKAGTCNHCGRRFGSKGRPQILRFAVPDKDHGVAGLGICRMCVSDWLDLFETKNASRN